MTKSNFICLGLAATLGVAVSCNKNPDVMAISNERTRRMMRDVRLPVIDWPEQPLTERLTLIEKELVNHGIEMEISEALRGRMQTRPMNYPELRVRDIPLIAAIQYTCDATVLSYKVLDSGVLLFRLIDEGSADERGSGVPASTPDDPFGK